MNLQKIKLAAQLEPSDELTALCYQVGSLRRYLIKKRSTLSAPAYYLVLKPDNVEETRAMLEKLPGQCRDLLSALRDFQGKTNAAHFQDACACLEELVADPCQLFRAPALQIYQNLRITNELMASIGVNVGPFAQKAPDNIIAKPPRDEPCHHPGGFGVTGLAKARDVLSPLLRTVLARDADDPEQRAGALILDEKHEMVECIHAAMIEAGRTDELLVIGPNGNAWFPPFGGQGADSRIVAKRLIDLDRVLHSAQGNGVTKGFWMESIRRILQVAAIMARARHFGDMTGIDKIFNELEVLINLHNEHRGDDDGEKHGNPSIIDESRSMLDLAAGLGAISAVDATLARNYIEFEDRQLNQRTWATIINCACGLISCLLDHKLAPILTPSSGWAFCADELIDRGRVVVVALNRDHYGQLAERFESLVKSAFLESAFQRRNRSYFDGYSLRPVNFERPIYLVSDAVPSLLVPGGREKGDS